MSMGEHHAGGGVSPHIEPTSSNWHSVTKSFVAAMEECQAYVVRLASATRDEMPETDPADAGQIMRAGSQQLAAMRRRTLLVRREKRPDQLAAPHPLLQLADAYAAAFTALSHAHLALDERRGRQLPQDAPGLANLAARAAAELPKAVGLVFGQLHLGTVASICERIATLEDQADRLRFQALRALVLRVESGTSPAWTPALAQDVYLLTILEALTDRCEAIAESLLLVQSFD